MRMGCRLLKWLLRVSWLRFDIHEKGYGELLHVHDVDVGV